MYDNGVMKAASVFLEGRAMAAGANPVDFGSWMASEQRRIYLLCLRLLRNGDEADSATQDVFVEAYRALQRSEGGAIREPAKWLTRVAVNTCFDRLRSKRWMFWQRRLRYADEEVILRLTPAVGLNQDDALMAREITRRLGNALARLSVRQRLVFVLRYEESRSLADIADVMGIDIGTVKAHMARALNKLREELRDLYVGSTLAR